MDNKSKKIKCGYCRIYMHLANLLCPKLSSDDYDELEDCCRGCTFWGTMEVEVEIFKVKCIKDYCKIKSGNVVDAFINGYGYFVIGGYMANKDEFKEYFEII